MTDAELHIGLLRWSILEYLMQDRGLMNDNRRIHVNAEEARSGWTPHVTRYVLAISLTAVVVLFAFIVLL